MIAELLHTPLPLQDQLTVDEYDQAVQYCKRRLEGGPG